MTKKIFRSTVAVGLAVLLASLVIIMGALYTYFGHVQEQQLRDELSIAAAAMESGDGEAYLSKLHSDNYRITWLRADGTVLYDTKADAAAMENHAQREEVRQAWPTVPASPAVTAPPCWKRPSTTPAACRTARSCACPPAASPWVCCF